MLFFSEIMAILKVEKSRTNPCRDVFIQAKTNYYYCNLTGAQANCPCSHSRPCYIFTNNKYRIFLWMIFTLKKLYQVPLQTKEW